MQWKAAGSVTDAHYGISDGHERRGNASDPSAMMINLFEQNPLIIISLN